MGLYKYSSFPFLLLPQCHYYYYHYYTIAAAAVYRCQDDAVCRLHLFCAWLNDSELLLIIVLCTVRTSSAASRKQTLLKSRTDEKYDRALVKVASDSLSRSLGHRNRINFFWLDAKLLLMMLMMVMLLSGE